jgi:hypothetical protein
VTRRALAAGLVLIALVAAACTSSGSDDPSAQLPVERGSIPAGSGWLVGSLQTPGGGRVAEAISASSGVLLGLPERRDAKDAGPPVVLRSTDEGRSWRRITMPGPSGTDIRTLWAGGGRAAVLSLEAIRPFVGGGIGTVRLSDDAGATWRAIRVPDPNGAGRWIRTGLWWKGQWIFFGAAERPGGPADPQYEAAWRSTDGRHLDYTPGLLPGGSQYVIGDGLTVIGDTLLAIGYSTRGGMTQVWRTTDGLHWTLVEPDVRALDGGALVRQRDSAISLDAGRTWREAEPGIIAASRTGSTWWFVQRFETGEHTAVQRFLRSDDDGRHLRRVALPPRAAPCERSASPDQVLDPPREVGNELVVISTCTPTNDALGSTGPSEAQIFTSRDGGRHWSTEDLPASARHGRPVAVTVRKDHMTVVFQPRPAGSRPVPTAVVTLHAR